VKFVIDAQLPPALARLLREADCDAFAVREIGLREASDAEIWRYAVQQQAAIITKDEDFAERCLYSRDQSVIVWLRNWQHIESGAVKMVRASVASNYPAH
jgi:predicted nuclease of predicted toxin-antitoxin system